VRTQRRCIQTGPNFKMTGTTYGRRNESRWNGDLKQIGKKWNVKS
jgi:hypothetical protein